MKLRDPQEVSIPVFRKGKKHELVCQRAFNKQPDTLKEILMESENDCSNMSENYKEPIINRKTAKKLHLSFNPSLMDVQIPVQPPLQPMAPAPQQPV